MARGFVTIGDDNKLPDVVLGRLDADIGLADTVVLATPKKFPDIDNTGVTSASAALQSVFNAAPAGSVVKMRGRYLLTTPVTIPPEKALTLDLSAATLVRGGGGTTLSCVGAFEAGVNITAIATETITIDGEPATVTRLTTETAPGWRPHDLIKVVSDDVIPGGHVTSDTVKPRNGEFIEVHSVSGTTVHLRGALREVYTTAPRAARLPFGTLKVIGGEFDVTDAVLANKTNGTMLRMQNLYSPSVYDTRATRLVGTGLSFKSCRGYFVGNFNVDYAMNDPANLVFGYGVHDSSCEDGVIMGGSQRGLRHPFTDGTATVVAGDPDFSSYGRTYNTKLVAVTSHGCTAAGFDTHQMSKGVQFIGCTAYVPAEVNGFLLRGEGHSVIGCAVYGGYSAVMIMTQETGTWSQGESRGMYITDLIAEGCNRVITGNVRGHANHPSFRVTDPEVTVTADGIRARNCTRFMVLINSNVRLRNIDFESGAHANGSFIQSENSLIHLGDYRWDLTRIATYDTASQRLIQLTDTNTGKGSTLIARNGYIATSAAYRTKATSPFYTSDKTKLFDVRGLELDGIWSAANAFTGINETVPQVFEWRYVHDPATANSQRSSSSTVVTNAALAGSIVSMTRSPDPQMILTANITDSTARTMQALPAGKYDGQRLSIILGSSTAALTVPHGASFNTRLQGSVDAVMAAGNDALHLMWSAGAWRETGRSTAGA